MVNKQQQTVTGLMRYLLVACGLFAVLLSSSFSSSANEAALYDLAPEGSAFLRVIDLRKSTPNNLSPGRLTIRIKSKRLSTAAYCSASEFIYLPSGEYRKQVNGVAWKGALEPNKAYSLVVDNESVRLLEDYRAEDSRRAVLAVYNFSRFPQLALQTDGSRRSVFTGISIGESSARAINPLKSAFAVIDVADVDGNSLAVTDAMIFQSGVLSSLFICEGDKGVFTRWADRVGGDQWL
jgi:hypothetical protein